jgi:adenosine deaminase/aminodeoxyfutalosine deaminase
VIDYLRGLPKAELHLHLEGSVRESTLLELAPELDAQEICERYRYENFAGFLQSYKWVNQFIREPSHYALIMARLIEELEAQGVSRVELNVSAGVVLWKNEELEPRFEAIEAVAKRSRMRVGFVFDAVRQFGVEAGWKVAEYAVKWRDRGVIGFGIGGDETRGPAAAFREIFEFASKSGLHVLPHAGETEGPKSIWEALEGGAARIGHGIRAIEDPELMKHLRERDIPLEVCISSNVCTGAVERLSDHPIRKLYDAGVPVTLNTDDPAMFHTTLLDEYALAAREFGFGESELAGLASNSLRYSLV